MDAHADIHLTQGDTSQGSLAESLTMGHGREPGNTLLKEDSVPDNLDSASYNVSYM